MVCPEPEIQPEDPAEFCRRALLLLADIRDTNARICAALERLLPNTADDPRYKQTGSWR